MTGFISAKAQALLIYLAVTGRPHSREALATLLWADTPASARNNLKKALSNLRNLPGIPLVEQGTKTVEVDRASCLIDVVEFAELANQLGSIPSHERLQRVSNLYADDFLAGFNLSLSIEFETWALAEQSRLRAQMIDLLRDLAEAYAQGNDHSLAIAALRRVLALEPWREETHHRIMEWLLCDGQRGAALAQFTICQAALAAELAVAPGPEISALYHQIQEGSWEEPPIAPRPIPTSSTGVDATTHPANGISVIAAYPTDGATTVHHVPPFLAAEDKPAEQGTHRFFAAREDELALLESRFRQSGEGSGQVTFVVGEAGSGKSTLVAEFTRRLMAEATLDNLVVATGHCNAYGGLGDPYLPFREIVALVTGDVESRYQAGTLSRTHAQRLWSSTPAAIAALLQEAVGLLDIFVAPTALQTRAIAAGCQDAPWFPQLAALAAHGHRQEQQDNTNQSALFSMFTKLMQALAQRGPLLLVLEDLHWADSGTLSLLFHLGRHLAGQRILILGTYRPDDVAVGRHSAQTGLVERHPLEPLVHEFQRLFGNPSLDLAETDGVHFVASLLRGERNRLPPAFQEQLFQHTRGHALFTVEILRAFQKSGGLIRDGDGCWIQGPQIDWTRAPNRVEGVIAERIRRLPPSLIEILHVAAVMGEEFIAEIPARILNLAERDVVRDVSRVLDQQYRLVQRSDQQRLGQQRLSRFRFRHRLFQQHLYAAIDPTERSYLHEDVGQALEALYGEEAAEIALPLAHHFQEAGLIAKQLTYVAIAAQRARESHAYHEAVDQFQMALALFPVEARSADESRKQIELTLSLGEAHWLAGQIPAALATYQRAADDAIVANEATLFARAAVGYEDVRYRFNLPIAPAAKLLQEASELLGDVESGLKVRLLGYLARTGVDPQQRCEAAVAMARRVNDPKALFDVLHISVLEDRRPDALAAHLHAVDEALALAQAMGDRNREVQISSTRLVKYLEAGALETVDAALEHGLALAEETQQAFQILVMDVLQAMRAILAGRFAEGRRLAQQALTTGTEMQVENADGTFGIQMFTIQRELGQIRQLAPIIRHFVERNPEQATWRPGLALIYADLGLTAEAQALFDELAVNDFAGLTRDALWIGSMVYMAEVCAFLGDERRAMTLYRLLLPHAGQTVVIGFGTVCLGAVDRYLGLLAQTMHQWSQAEAHFSSATAVNRRLDARPWLAHTLVDGATLLLQRDQPADQAQAVAQIQEARSLADDLGMVFLLKKLEHLAHGDSWMI